MTVWGKVSAQFGRPTGIQGAFAGLIMANRGSNRERMQWSLSILNLRPADRVLEIGFGPGVAIREMARIVTEGIIIGIDHSDVMVRQASRRNREPLNEGRVRLHRCAVSDMPQFELPIDKVLDINSFQFWPSPAEDLRTLRSIMAPGGRIVLVHQPRKPGSTDRETDRAGERVADYLTKTGFSEISVQRKEMKPVSCVCVTGRN